MLARSWRLPTGFGRAAAAVGIAAEVRSRRAGRRMTERAAGLRRRVLHEPPVTAAALNVQTLRAAASELGVDVEELPGGFLRLRHGDSVSLAYGTNFAFEPLVPYFVCGDKTLTSALLAERGLPVPRSRSFGRTQYAEAVRYFWSLSGPAVTKPARDTYGGAGVTVGVRTAREFRRGFATAATYPGGVLVEARVPGQDVRVTVLDGQVLGAVLRVPAHVTGDGRASVAMLVAVKNERWRRGARDNTLLRPIALDADARRVLRGQGLSPASVPGAGRVVRLREVCNADRGGEIHDVELHGNHSELALEAARATGAVLCGVDLLVVDPAGPARPGRVYVNEVNTTPSLYVANGMLDGRPSSDAADAVLRRLFALTPREDAARADPGLRRR
jgi:cyanophycin synthetase